MAPYDQLLQRGITKLTGGEFQSAIADFDEAQKLNPNDSSLYANRGSAYFELEDAARALADVDQAIRLGARTSSIYFLRARCYGALGEGTRAVADYNEAIRLDPNNHQALAHRGNLLNMYAQGRLGLPDLEKAVALQPENAQYRSMRGILYAATDNFDGAIADLTYAIESGRASADNYFYRGMTYVSKKNAASAISDYRQALQLEPDHKYAYIMRPLTGMVEAAPDADSGEGRAAALIKQAAALQKSGDLNGALNALSEAIAINPNDPIAYSARSLIYARLERPAEAVESASQAIALKPDFADAYANRGTAYILMKRGQDALADLNKAISLGVRSLYRVRMAVLNESPAGLGDLDAEATGLAQKNDLAAALEKFDEIIRRAPDYSGVYGNRGNVRRLLKDYAGAISDYTKAIELQSQNAYALFGRGMAYVEQPTPDYALADADFTAAIEVTPEIGMFYRSRAVAKLKLGHYLESMLDFERYGALGGWKAERPFIESSLALAREALSK
jgi:tetratricopeptide (TPR) repeat protein